MIRFRKKSLIQDLMPEALEYLRSLGKRPNIITIDQADAVSKVNSKAMVLESFIKNDSGFYQIKIRDKELYKYTQKLLKEMFNMRILDIDKKERSITAEVEHKGMALDIIEILALKYTLSIVMN